MREGLEKGKLSILLRGEKLKGSFALVQDQGSEAVAADQAQGPLRDGRATSRARTARCCRAATVEEMKFVPVQRMPAARLVPARQGRADARASSRPMLAEIGDAAFNRADWMWEPKLDGYRVLAFIDEDGVKLRSRRGLDLAEQVSAAGGRARASRRCNGMVLDGEIVAFDASGKPSFAALQNRAQLKTSARSPRPTNAARRLLLLRPAAFRRHRPAQGAVCRPAALSRAVPAAVAAGAARARARGRRRAARRGARERLRGRDRQAQGQPLRGRQALAVVAQGQADATAPISSSAATRRARARARRWARCWSATGTTSAGKLRFASHVGSGLRRARRWRRSKTRLEPLRRERPARSPRSRSSTRRRPGSSRSWSPK